MAACFFYPKHFSRHTAAMAQLVERTFSCSYRSRPRQTNVVTVPLPTVRKQVEMSNVLGRMSLVTGDVARQRTLTAQWP